MTDTDELVKKLDEEGARWVERANGEDHLMYQAARRLEALQAEVVRLKEELGSLEAFSDQVRGALRECKTEVERLSLPSRVATEELAEVIRRAYEEAPIYNRGEFIAAAVLSHLSTRPRPVEMEAHTEAHLAGAEFATVSPTTERGTCYPHISTPSRPVEMEGWQPIETAPQGRKVIVAFKEGEHWRRVMAEYAKPYSIEVEGDGPDDAFDEDDGGALFLKPGWYEHVHSSDMPGWRINPTHWMPLPSPPGVMLAAAPHLSTPAPRVTENNGVTPSERGSSAALRTRVEQDGGVE